MASDDAKIFAAKQRLQQINAERTQAQADLAVAEANNDYHGMADAEEEIAKADLREQALVALGQRYIASQQVPEPPVLTDEERHAKPLEKMDWDDALALARTSQYGRSLRHDDPNVRAGYAEVMRRRQRGE